ncbi:GGH (predicted) [Pycnogonum litorale]
MTKLLRIATLCFLWSAIFADSTHKVNNRPIIGIVAETSRGAQKKYGYSFIASSYVKYVESGGARVVPVLLNREESYYEKLFYHLNGLLIPGGGQHLVHSPYQRAVEIFFKLSMKEYDKSKDHFPIWGSCLGFELLHILPVHANILSYCDTNDVALPIMFYPGYNTSRMFRDMPEKIHQIYLTENVTANYHHRCVTQKMYDKHPILKKLYKPLAYNYDSKNGSVFISAVEGNKYPFYGVQWHPEKVIFTWSDMIKHGKVPHDIDSVIAAQYLANFFVNEARKSQHRFPSKREESDNLIYNYDPVYVGKDKHMIYDEIYVFKDVRVKKDSDSSGTHLTDGPHIVFALILLLQSFFMFAI